MLADRVRIGRKKGGIYLAQDDDFVKVFNRWVYRGSKLEIEIPYIIQGEEITTYNYMFYGTGNYLATPVTRVVSNNKSVTSMNRMFYGSSATTLDLSSLNTSNVTDMSRMFQNSSATTLDLSSFDTSNVTNMSNMFNGSSATILDLSSFDTSNVTSMTYMFLNSSATTGYARTQADADRFNNSSGKPSALVFVVK
jgi:surface protein